MSFDDDDDDDDGSVSEHQQAIRRAECIDSHYAFSRSLGIAMVQYGAFVEFMGEWRIIIRSRHQKF